MRDKTSYQSKRRASKSGVNASPNSPALEQQGPANKHQPFSWGEHFVAHVVSLILFKTAEESIHAFLTHQGGEFRDWPHWAFWLIALAIYLAGLLTTFSLLRALNNFRAKSKVEKYETPEGAVARAAAGLTEQLASPGRRNFLAALGTVAVIGLSFLIAIQKRDEG